MAMEQDDPNAQADDTQNPLKNYLLKQPTAPNQPAQPAQATQASPSYMPPNGNTGVNGGATASAPQAQTQAAPTYSNGQPGITAGMSPDQIRQQVQGYYDFKGVAPSGNSVDYWTSKAPELIARGKELQPGGDGTWYLNKFLSNAEEFTGGADATAKAMWGASRPPAGGGGSMGSGWSGGNWGDRANSLYGMLMNRAGQSLDINAKDPIIANQVNAYNAQTQRAGNDYLRQQAEQAGPQGNLAQERRMVAEKAGQAGGQFQASLMQNELNARRAEIQNALNGAAGFLTDQQRMELQAQLSQMDNALQYAQLGQNAYQFDVNDEFRRSPLA